MHPLIIPIILLIGGLYFLVKNIRYLRDQTELEAYLTTSPTGKAWIKKFGREKTIELSKKYFLPLGIVIAIVMLGISSWSITRLLPNYL